MRRILMALMLMAAVCAGGCGERKSGPVQPDAPAPVDRRATVTPEGLIKVSDPARFFVGPLHLNIDHDDTLPLSHCVEGERQMAGAALRLGRVNLFGIDIDGLPKPGGWFVAEGQRRPDLYSRLRDQGACVEGEQPGKQRRGDWDADEGGWFSRRARLEAVDYIEASALIAAPELLAVEAPEFAALRDALRGGDQAPQGDARVTLKNPFAIPWSGVAVVFHYESVTKGKPMPHEERVVLTLAAGASQAAIRPLVIGHEVVDGRIYVFQSAYLEGGQPAALGSPFFRP